MTSKRTGRRLLLVGSVTALLLLGSAAGCVQRHTVSSGMAVSIDSQTQDQLNQLDKTAERFVTQVDEGNVSAARATLRSIAEQVTQIPYEGVTTVRGIQALTETVTGAQEVVSAAGFQPQEAVWAAVRLRLATDALSHPHQPMWRQYRTGALGDAEQLEMGARQRSQAKAAAALTKLEGTLRLLQPALRISGKETELAKLNSLIGAIQQQLRSEPVDYKQVIDRSGDLNAELKQLFDGGRDAPTMAAPLDRRQPILWTLTMAGAVLAALAYAGFRMYRFETDAVVPARRPDRGEDKIGL